MRRSAPSVGARRSAGRGAFRRFCRPDPPVQPDPFLPMVGWHREAARGERGMWLQVLKDPSAERLQEAIESVASLREIEVFTG